MKNNSSKETVEKLKTVVKSPTVKNSVKELLKSIKDLRDTFDIDN